MKILEGRVEGDLRHSLDELRSNPLPPSYDVSLDEPDNLESVSADLQPAGPNGKPQPINPAIEEINDAAPGVERDPPGDRRRQDRAAA